MDFTDREIALLMVAADNTANSLREAMNYPFVDTDQLEQEAITLDNLWTRLNEERTFRQEEQR